MPENTTAPSPNRSTKIDREPVAPVAPVLVEDHMIGPAGQIVRIGTHYGLTEAKRAAGWREATTSELAAAAKR